MPTLYQHIRPWSNHQSFYILYTNCCTKLNASNNWISLLNVGIPLNKPKSQFYVRMKDRMSMLPIHHCAGLEKISP